VQRDLGPIALNKRGASNHRVHLLVSAKFIQPANTIFLSKKPTPVSPNQHQHQLTNRVNGRKIEHDINMGTNNWERKSEERN